MKVIGTITNAPDFVESETVWLKSDEKRNCPMSVVKVHYSNETSCWLVTCLWVDRHNNMCEDDFSPKLLVKKSKFTRREVVFVPDWD